VTDAKGALDNAVRVLQAMIDVSSDAGWLGVTLRLMNLQQQLMQGRRVEDPSLATLPGVSLELARLAVASAARNAQSSQTSAKGGNTQIGTLPELVSLCHRDVNAARTALEKALQVNAGRGLDNALAVASRLPVVDVTVTRAFSDENERKVEVRLTRATAGGERTSGGKGRGFGNKTDRGTGQTDTKHRVTDTGISKSTPPNAVTPFYPKLKQEGWWVVLGDPSTGELLAMRRVSFGTSTLVNLSYEHLDRGDDDDRFQDLTVFLVSDCYIGLDQEVPVGNSGGMGKQSGGGKRSVGPGAVAKHAKREDLFWRRSDDASDSDDDAFFWEHEKKYLS
jgi:activating signal cointegrator complex subunit 3